MLQELADAEGLNDFSGYSLEFDRASFTMWDGHIGYDSSLSDTRSARKRRSHFRGHRDYYLEGKGLSAV